VLGAKPCIYRIPDLGLKSNQLVEQLLQVGNLSSYPLASGPPSGPSIPGDDPLLVQIPS
jgi:hypothetical protein